MKQLDSQLGATEEIHKALGEVDVETREKLATEQQIATGLKEQITVLESLGKLEESAGAIDKKKPEFGAMLKEVEDRLDEALRTTFTEGGLLRFCCISDHALNGKTNPSIEEIRAILIKGVIPFEESDLSDDYLLRLIAMVGKIEMHNASFFKNKGEPTLRDFFLHRVADSTDGIDFGRLCTLLAGKFGVNRESVKNVLSSVYKRGHDKL